MVVFRVVVEKGYSMSWQKAQSHYCNSYDWVFVVLLGQVHCLQGDVARGPVMWR